MNLSDNATHLIQLVAMLATMSVLIIFAPSIPPTVILAAFVPVVSGLIGAKMALTASSGGALPAALAANTAATAANTAATAQPAHLNQVA